MTINNIGGSGNMLPLQADMDKKEVMKKDAAPEGPDNYPTYGDKCSIGDLAPESLISLQDGRASSASGEAETEEYRIKGDEEGPDNYPSYGGKSVETEEIKPEKPAVSSVILPREEDSEEYYIIKGPDNYPSYGGGN